MRKDKVADLPSLSGANLVSRAEVNSGIDPRVNNLLNTFTKRVPLTRDTCNCRGDKRVWVVSEDELHDCGNGRTVR